MAFSQTMSVSPSAHSDVFRHVLSVLSEGPVDDDTLSHFLRLLDTKFQEANLQISPHRPSTVQENRAQFAVKSKDDATRWEALKTSHPDQILQWKTMAPRIALKAGGTRKLTGYDAFRLFKGVMPPMGDGTSIIPRP